MCIPAFITYKGSEHMPTIGNKIKFRAGTYASYAALLANNETDSDAIYFCTDTHQLFVGDKEYTRPVLSGSTAPSASLHSFNPIGALYYNTGNSTLYANLSTGWSAIATNFTYSNATTSTAGLMSSTDKSKLDSITPANILAKSDIVVCTQAEYDAMQTRSGLLYFIKEASS